MDGPAEGSALHHVQSFLDKHPTMKHFCLNVNDYAGVERTRLISARQALQTASTPNHPDGATSGGPLNWAATRTQALMFDVVIGLGQTDHWIPDWSTAKPSAKSQSLAEVQCSIREGLPWSAISENEWEKINLDGNRDERDEMSGDSRVILKRLEDQVREEHEIDFKVGYEIEFALLPARASDHLVETSSTLYSPENVRAASFQVILQAAEHLEASGVGCWNYHSEGPGNGKFELSLAPFAPSEAADNLLYAMRVIRDVASRLGYYATMHPHVFEAGSTTVGQHIHFSLSKTELADNFLAGVLNRMEQLTAFLLSGYDSYTAARAAMYGQGYIYWSYDKVTPVRDVDHGHWEFRMPDTMCNPHLQLAALIFCGMDGVGNKRALAAPRHGVDISKMTDKQREEAGVHTGPRSLDAAISALEKEKKWWSERLSENCITGLIRNRREEVSVSTAMTYKQRTDAIFWGETVPNP